MDGNPYSMVAALLAGTSDLPAAPGAGPARIRVGVVVSASPLRISVAGVTLPAGCFLIDERIKKGYRHREQITFDSPPEWWTSDGKASVEQLEPYLDTGDRVLLLTEDDQLFYIVMKAVSA